MKLRTSSLSFSFNIYFTYRDNSLVRLSLEVSESVLQNKSRQHVCRTPVGTARVRYLIMLNVMLKNNYLQR